MIVAPDPIAHSQQESLMWKLASTRICCVSTVQAWRNEEITLLCVIVGVIFKKVRKRNLARTHAISIKKYPKGIDWRDLSRTFQDAVTTKRELHVRFLWIDLICMIQPHKGCCNECDKVEDWDVESKKMEKYFNSAYCIIAVTSARDPTEGFLDPRPVGQCVKVSSDPCNLLYVCNVVSDFGHDVEQGVLNLRAWVLQERALSCRTVHFTTPQTYWECGKKIHCENLTRMSNPAAKSLDDRQFPRSAIEYAPSSRSFLFERHFELYSKRLITNRADRSIAISGLETRLAKTFETDRKYGVFGRYLHRSLL